MKCTANRPQRAAANVSLAVPARKKANCCGSAATGKECDDCKRKGAIEPLPGPGHSLDGIRVMRRSAELDDTGGSEGGGGGAAPASAPSAGTCKYTVHYKNLKTSKCEDGKCGARLQYQVTGVTAAGAGCPATLNGLVLKEKITTNNGCGPGKVQPGIGCLLTTRPDKPLEAKTVLHCADDYELCADAANFPEGGCTEVYTQEISVGDALAETRHINWRISKSGDRCSGTGTRT